MATIIKAECAACAASLELLPGINRIICPKCGSAYLIQRDGPDERQNVQNGSKDNPAEVKLIKVNINECDLVVSAKSNILIPASSPIKGLAVSGAFSDEDLASFEEDLDVKLKLFAALSYLSGETYKLLIGRVPLDRHPMYSELYTNSFDRGFENDGSLTVNEINSLKEIDKVFFDITPDLDKLALFDGSRTEAKFTIKKCYYDKPVDVRKLNKEYSAKLLNCINALISKYQLSYKDTQRYSIPEWNYQTVYNLFGKSKLVSRFISIKYIERELYLDMDPGKAAAILGESGIAAVNKIKNNGCIVEISAIFYKFLNTWENLQLSKRCVFPTRFIVSDDMVSVSVDWYKVIHNGNSLPDHSICIKYSEYGMNNITEPLIKMYLKANLMYQINELAKQNNTFKWGFTTTDLIACESRTEGKYNDWV